VPKFFEGFADRLRVPEGARDVQVFDEDLPGFGIRKFASGRASYFVKYGIGVQQRRLTLGKVVRGNLKTMRLEASKVLAKARLGTDTAAVVRAAAAKAEVTLGQLVPRYLHERQPNWRPRYYAEVKRQLEKDWKSLHGVGIEAITRQVVAAELDDIAARQGDTAADRARTALSGIFGWAIEPGYCDSNPSLGISPRSSQRARDRVMTESELVEVWQAAGDGEYGIIVKLLILTGQRRLEIGDLSWFEIDLEKRQIELPAERTKAGRPHIIPLSAPAFAIISAISERKGRDLVFGQRAGGFSGWSKAKTELDGRIGTARKEAGVNATIPAWRLHDLRRSFVTHVNERGFAQPHVVEAIVNHISGHLAGVAGVYNKALYLAERRQALELWGAHIGNLVAVRADNRVVPLKRHGRHMRHSI
jgi:integrase